MAWETTYGNSPDKYLNAGLMIRYRGQMSNRGRSSAAILGEIEDFTDGAGGTDFKAFEQLTALKSGRPALDYISAVTAGTPKPQLHESR
jgi:hypothetical protein